MDVIFAETSRETVIEVVSISQPDNLSEEKDVSPVEGASVDSGLDTDTSADNSWLNDICENDPVQEETGSSQVACPGEDGEAIKEKEENVSRFTGDMDASKDVSVSVEVDLPPCSKKRNSSVESVYTPSDENFTSSKRNTSVFEEQPECLEIERQSYCVEGQSAITHVEHSENDPIALTKCVQPLLDQESVSSNRTTNTVQESDEPKHEGHVAESVVKLWEKDALSTIQFRDESAVFANRVIQVEEEASVILEVESHINNDWKLREEKASVSANAMGKSEDLDTVLTIAVTESDIAASGFIVDLKPSAETPSSISSMIQEHVPFSSPQKYVQRLEDGIFEKKTSSIEERVFSHPISKNTSPLISETPDGCSKSLDTSCDLLSRETASVGENVSQKARTIRRLRDQQEIEKQDTSEETQTGTSDPTVCSSCPSIQTKKKGRFSRLMKKFKLSKHSVQKDVDRTPHTRGIEESSSNEVCIKAIRCQSEPEHLCGEMDESKKLDDAVIFTLTQSYSLKSPPAEQQTSVHRQNNSVTSEPTEGNEEEQSWEEKSEGPKSPKLKHGRLEKHRTTYDKRKIKKSESKNVDRKKLNSPAIKETSSDVTKKKRPKNKIAYGKPKERVDEEEIRVTVDKGAVTRREQKESGSKNQDKKSKKVSDLPGVEAPSSIKRFLRRLA